MRSEDGGLGSCESAEPRLSGSTGYANFYLGESYLKGLAKNSFNPRQGVSDLILDRYRSDPNEITVGSDIGAKIENPLLVDYGPAGLKFHNAIHAILTNPDDPIFAPYVNNLYSAGVALENGTNPALTASTIAAYLRRGAGVYQSNMSVNGDPATGVKAWGALDPSTQNALLVQFYKQGPTPNRVLTRMMTAAQDGVPYVSQVGVDGAGATYLANEPAITQALADGPANFSDRWSATRDFVAHATHQKSAEKTGGAAPSQVNDNRRYLGKSNVGQASAFDERAPAVPFVQSNEALFSDAGSLENWNASSRATRSAPPLASPPLGLFTNMPMPNWPVPPPIFGVEGSSGRGDISRDSDDARKRTGIPFLDEYIGYLSRP